MIPSACSSAVWTSSVAQNRSKVTAQEWSQTGRHLLLNMPIYSHYSASFTHIILQVELDIWNASLENE